MDNVFIVSMEDEAAAPFGTTLETGCALETVLPFLDDTQADALRRLCPDGTCHAWGVRDERDNRSTWEGMTPDDLVLGVRSRSIVSASTVLMKVRNPLLADRLWGRTAEGPFELMCFTDKPHVGEVPIVSQMRGYLDEDYGGFTRLSPDKCKAILHAFGSLEIFVRLGLRYDFPFSFRHSE
jgi:hypothetical protein